MRKAIYSVHIQPPGMKEKLIKAYNASLSSKGAYACRIGADLIVKTIKTFSFTGWQSPERLDMWQLFEKYDRVLYVDADVLIRPDAPDIFEVYKNDDDLHLLNECPNPQVNYSYKTLINETETGAFKYINQRHPEFIPPKWYPYYNCGVILASRKHAEVFKYEKDKYFETVHMEQDYLNYRIWNMNFPVMPLPIDFNGMILLVKEEDYLKRCYFIHYIGMENRGGREKLYDDWRSLNP